jgi:hypothetical protein
VRIANVGYANEREPARRELTVLLDAPLESLAQEEPSPSPRPSSPRSSARPRTLSGPSWTASWPAPAGRSTSGVALNLTTVNGGAIDRDQLASRMTGALKIDDSAALAAIAELITARLYDDLPADDLATAGVC